MRLLQALRKKMEHEIKVIFSILLALLRMSLLIWSTLVSVLFKHYKKYKLF
jgi:hypothetical protein